jgi:hypothetical protein
VGSASVRQIPAPRLSKHSEISKAIDYILKGLGGIHAPPRRRPPVHVESAAARSRAQRDCIDRLSGLPGSVRLDAGGFDHLAPF